MRHAKTVSMHGVVHRISAHTYVIGMCTSASADFYLFAHEVHEVRPGDALGEAWEVLNFGGAHELPTSPVLKTLEYDGLTRKTREAEISPRRVLTRASGISMHITCLTFKFALAAYIAAV